VHFIKVTSIIVLRNNFSRFLFDILPLHVSALAGHLQAEYTIILGSYFNYNGSVVFLCIPPVVGQHGPKHVWQNIYMK
jgi:hypothetical protein